MLPGVTLIGRGQEAMKRRREERKKEEKEQSWGSSGSPQLSWEYPPLGAAKPMLRRLCGCLRMPFPWNSVPPQSCVVPALLCLRIPFHCNTFSTQSYMVIGLPRPSDLSRNTHIHGYSTLYLSACLHVHLSALTPLHSPTNPPLPVSAAWCNYSGAHLAMGPLDTHPLLHYILFYFWFLNFFFIFRDRVSLCNPGCPETHSIDHMDSTSEIYLSLPPKCWD